MSKITYKIKGDLNENLRETVIVSKGYTSEFTLAQMDENIKKADKSLTEFEANAEIQKSVMENIETHNPFILAMSDKDLHACHMYFEAKAQYNTYSDKVREIKVWMKNEEDDMNEITKQIPQLALVESVKSEELESLI